MQRMSLALHVLFFSSALQPVKFRLFPYTTLFRSSECCVATGDGGCEAYTAIAWGVGLSHERSDIAGAEGFHSLEGNMCGTAMRGADGPAEHTSELHSHRQHGSLRDLVSSSGRGARYAEYGG